MLAARFRRRGNARSKASSAAYRQGFTPNQTANNGWIAHASACSPGSSASSARAVVRRPPSKARDAGGGRGADRRQNYQVLQFNPRPAAGARSKLSPGSISGRPVAAPGGLEPPPGTVRVPGRADLRPADPIADIIATTTRGLCGPAIGHARPSACWMRQGLRTPRRLFPNGRVIELTAMPGGGCVMSFTDITACEAEQGLGAPTSRWNSGSERTRNSRS